MNKNAFQALLWANPKSMAKSFEQSFYDENSSLFSPATNYLNENRSMFDIIKSNIVLFGLLNRKLLNREIDEFPSSSLDDKNVQEALLLQLPYLLYNGKRLYIPTYSLEINELYSSSQRVLKDEKKEYLKDENFDVIDPFKVYGLSLFDTPFTRLVKLEEESKDIKAYYHVDFDTLFFINNDCNLVCELPLFDDKLKERDELNLFANLNTIAKLYFTSDTKTLFLKLKELHLLSSSLVDECLLSHSNYLKRHNDEI